MCIKKTGTKLKIITFVHYYIPGYKGGGSIRTIEAMVECLSDKFEFYIITKDRDSGDRTAYKKIPVNSWNKVGRAKVFYASKDYLTLCNIAKIIKNTSCDLIYLNSFFDFSFTVKPLILSKIFSAQSKPVVLAPRGEFSEGALRIKKAKKWLYIKTVSLFKLYGGCVFQASTFIEAEEIKAGFFKHMPGKDAPDLLIATNLNIVAKNNPLDRKISESEVGTRLKVCFLSRISPKKNLDFALKVLSKINSQIRFSIYGPIDSKTYWNECEKLMQVLPGNILVEYKGTVEHSNVVSTISDYDLFFLPTLGENFGHVFLESFVAGVPVLTSDRTPWRDLGEYQVGWDVSLDRPDEFVKIIEKYAFMGQGERQKISRNCIKYATKTGNDRAVVESNIALFLKAFEGKKNT